MMHIKISKENEVAYILHNMNINWHLKIVREGGH